MNYSTDLYKTSDLACATVISLFYPIKEIERKNPKKVYFIFERNDKLDKLLDQYWQQKLKVEPQSFFNQLKIIKARIYNEELDDKPEFIK